MTDAPRRFWKQAFDIYIFQGLAMAVSLVGSVIVARTLGPSGKGTLDLFGLLSTVIVEAGLLGVGGGVLFQLANRKKALAEVHGDVVAMSLAAGAIGILLAALASGPIAGLLGAWPVRYAAVALALTTVLAYSGLWPNLMIGSDRTATIYRMQLVLAAGTTGSILALWLAGALWLDTVIGVSVLVMVGGAAIQFGLARRMHDGAPVRPRRESIAASLAYGLRIYPGMIANWTHFRIDQVVISHFIGVSGVGLYALSVRWAEMLWLVGYGALNAGLFRIASGSRADAYRFTVKLFVLVTALSGSAGLVLALAAQPLFGLLYGPAFQPSVLPLVLLIPGVVAWDASRVLANYISFNLGRPQLPTTVAVVGAGLNIVLIGIAVPRWGISGAAAASSLSYAVVLLTMMLIFRRVA